MQQITRSSRFSDLSLYVVPTLLSGSYVGDNGVQAATIAPHAGARAYVDGTAFSRGDVTAEVTSRGKKCNTSPAAY
jgi:hypothetical protein